jgi:uridine kinase
MNRQPVVIAVGGGSGSGKTTVTLQILERIGPQAVAVISHDFYYRDLEQLPRVNRDRLNFDHPDALESSRLIEDLRRLRAGHMIQAPIYDYTTHSRKIETQPIEPRKVILVEGILIYVEKALRELFDVKIFVDADSDVRLMRRLRRDVAERGRSVESVLEQYETTVRPMHLEFVEPSKRWADLIIPGGGMNDVALEFLVARITALTE